MKSFRFRNLLSVCLVGLGMTLCASLASADTLQFVQNNYGQTGPYSFHINGSSALTPLICMSDKNEVRTGEIWQATGLTAAQAAVGTNTPGFTFTITQLNELGWLANQLFAAPGTAAIQNAIWYISDGGGAFNSWVTAAKNAVTGGYTTADIFFFPVYDNNHWKSSNFDGLGEPQPFIEAPPVPEPASLIMFGTGILACAGVIRRRLFSS